MSERHWQIFARLSARNEAPHLELLDAVPGTAISHFEDGSSEAAMIIDADTAQEVVLLVRLAMLELALEVTSMTVTEIWPEPGEVFAPISFEDVRLMRAQSWARALSHPLPITFETADGEP